jgi:hypothetical protein
MDDRHEPLTAQDFSTPDRGPFVPLVLTLLLLALIVLVFWVITVTSMAAVGGSTANY